MLSLRDVTLMRGARVLFSRADLTVHAGQKVGLTGANGSGKTSLLALLRGELATDAGEVEIPSGIVIAHVAQETPADPRDAIEYVLDGDVGLRSLETDIAEAEYASADGGQAAGARLGELHARFDAIDGYTARARAARLLAGLGFAPGEELRPVKSFSGGWRVRLNLARALMCRSDLLLLDEPTNHLDLDAVIWLESWLAAYRGTLLLISHDRDFLDRVVGHIVHIERGAVRLYTGNYTAFEKARAEQLAVQQAAYAKQQREIVHMRSFVDRFRYKASKARQAQSRLKALERMEQIAPAHVDSPFTFGFREPKRMPPSLLTLDKVAAGYGEHEVLRGLVLEVRPGDRVALLGANGAGKSTLIKVLAGELAPSRGERVAARELSVGYFAQHQLEQLRDADSPLIHLRRLDREVREQELRNFLGGFAFSGEMSDAPVGRFSGGERARLVLAMILYARPNLLLLDEPTNHLDLEMRHALNVALQDFSGALVLVSHDRHLLRTTADDLLLVHDGVVDAWAGDLDDYGRWLAGDRRGALPVADAPQATPAEAAAIAPRTDARERRQQGARLREQLKPLRQQVQRQEKILERVHREQRVLEERLADGSLYEEARRDELKGLLIDKARLEHQLQEAETEWLAASEALENAEREAAVG